MFTKILISSKIVLKNLIFKSHYYDVLIFDLTSGLMAKINFFPLKILHEIVTLLLEVEYANFLLWHLYFGQH